MARIHVLDTTGGLCRLIFHITVPAGSNSAGVTWVAAIKATLTPTTSVLSDGDGTGGTISAAEKADLLNGVVFEAVDRVFIPPGLNATQANAYLDALHAAKTTEVTAQIAGRLPYAGYTRT